MQQRTQYQHQGRKIVRSSIPHRISSQNIATRQKVQHQGTAERGFTILFWLQQLSHTMQIIVGVIAALIVAGIIALFILAALFPNAYIGIAGLSSSIGTFIGGFLAGKVEKKQPFL